MGSFFYQVGPPNKAGRTEPGTPPPTVAKPPGRLHQVGIKALQSGVSYHLRELDSHEERASGLLQARDPEVRVMVRGEFVLESNAIENLSVRIDGVIYARHNLRWATAGMEVCRVAGKTPIRSGNLLSP